MSTKLLGNGDLNWNAAMSSGVFVLEKHTAAVSGTLKTIKLNCSGALTAKVSIYADNSGSPGALLAANNDSTSCVSGWNSISISDVDIVSGTVYWLGFIANGTYAVKYLNSGSFPVKYKALTYSTFTAPNPAGSGYSATTIAAAIAGWGDEPVNASWGGTWGG